MTRAAIYVRVSTTNQEEEGTSLSTQEERCRAFAAARDYGVIEVFSDVHTGAQYRDRPGLSALRDLVRARGADVVICYAIDRLSRNQAHLYIIAEDVEEHGGRIEFVTENFEDSAIGRFLRSASAFAGEVEREKMIERTMRGKHARAKSGKLIPAVKALYGYRWRDASKAALDVDPDTAPIVQRIYREALAGSPLRVIAKGLSKDGIATPSGRSTSWSHTAIRDILKHPNYTGNAVAWAWRRDPKRKTRIVFSLDDAVTLPAGTVPALVDLESWQSVQETLTVNKAQASRNNRAPRMTLLRGGYATCGYCGRNMHVTRQRNSMLNGREPKSIYMCSGGGSHANPCGSHAILAATLDAAVWERVAQVLMEPGFIGREVERLKATDPTSGQLEKLDRQVADVQRRQSNLMRELSMFDDPALGADIRKQINDLSQRRRELEDERSAIQSERALWEQAQANLDNLTLWRDTVATNLDDLSYEERRLALDALGIEVKVYRKDHDPRYEITATIPVIGPIVFDTCCSIYRSVM
ncbi:MAG: recombinase family protein [Chloroflexia bacterium]|nr:recombinase family protein [Chloroflexia bacterium]